ncbi:hypothetical protein NPIL_33751 [Nephila pilipes]|uniref:Uncharacterized protein n=1 Tax=Nephila pilipes TaxID=299642 RepID=A0A8X6QZI4_NEPPI|nr:hypothetical protein NPIL_33751 [Nephila pilipes]
MNYAYVDTMSFKKEIPGTMHGFDKKAVFKDLQFQFIKYGKLLRTMRFLVLRNQRYVEFVYNLFQNVHNPDFKINYLQLLIVQDFSVNVWLMSEVMLATYNTISKLLRYMADIEEIIETIRWQKNYVNMIKSPKYHGPYYV